MRSYRWVFVWTSCAACVVEPQGASPGTTPTAPVSAPPVNAAPVATPTPASATPVVAVAAETDDDSPDDDLGISTDGPMPGKTVGTNATAAVAKPVTVTIDARADVFSATLKRASVGRGGVLPSRIELPTGSSRTLVVSRVVGKVGCGRSAVPSRPQGGACAGGHTDLQSADGISGIIDATSSQFLVGVFVAAKPTTAAPERLDFGSGALTHQFKTLAPTIGQSFYVGRGTLAGRLPRDITVPSGATALVLGIADGYGFQGPPSSYGDNTGAFRATLSIEAR